MEYLTYLLIPLTILGSYAHGAGDMLNGNPDKKWFESKGIYVAALALLGAGLGFLNLGYWGLLGALLSTIYWFGFRSSRQAHAELSYMHGVKDYTLLNIAAQYLLPVGLSIIPMLVAQLWIPAAIAALLIGGVVATSAITRLDEVWTEQEEREARAPVELANGLLGGWCISNILLAAIILAG